MWTGAVWEAAAGKQVKSVMTRMAVPKCQPFATILCLARSSWAGAVKLSGKWCVRSFTRMLGVTSSPCRSPTNSLAYSAMERIASRPAPTCERWRSRVCPSRILGLGAPLAPGLVWSVLAVSSRLPGTWVASTRAGGCLGSYAGGARRRGGPARTASSTVSSSRGRDQ